MRITYYMLFQEKYKQHSTWYSTKTYHPGLEDRQFQKVEMTSRYNTRKKKKKKRGEYD